MAAALLERGTRLHCAYDACGAPADERRRPKRCVWYALLQRAMRVTASSCLPHGRRSALCYPRPAGLAAFFASSLVVFSTFGLQSSGGAPEMSSPREFARHAGRLTTISPWSPRIGHVAETPSADAYARTVTALRASPRK